MLGTSYLSHAALVQPFSWIDLRWSRSREIIVGQRLYGGGSNYNGLRESDNSGVYLLILSANYLSPESSIMD
jgi:hypothetical protein